MPEKDILDKFEYYGHSAHSIEEAISRHGDKAFDIIRSCSFNDPEFFDRAVIDKVLAHFETSPYNCFSILHNLSVRLPDLTDQLMATYLDNFRTYPKGAIEEFYYVIANDRELALELLRVE